MSASGPSGPLVLELFLFEKDSADKFSHITGVIINNLCFHQIDTLNIWLHK